MRPLGLALIGPLFGFLACSAAIIDAPSPMDRALAVGMLGSGIDGGDYSQAQWEAYAARAKASGLHAHDAYRNGFAYCRNIENTSNSRGSAYQGWGIALSGLGLIGTGVAVPLSVSGASKDKPEQAVAAGAGVAGGIFVTALGLYLLEKSQAAWRASGAAGEGLWSSTEEAAWRECSKARRIWVEDNAKQLQQLIIRIEEGQDRLLGEPDGGTAASSRTSGSGASEPATGPTPSEHPQGH